jgi:hypothetical protein
MTVVPKAPGVSVVFLAPDNVRPARSNLPGIVQRGRWRAVFTAVPPEGITWEASFKSGSESVLAATTAIVISSRFPNGSGWQSLPAWLPQEHAVWHAELMWVVRP